MRKDNISKLAVLLAVAIGLGILALYLVARESRAPATAKIPPATAAKPNQGFARAGTSTPAPVPTSQSGTTGRTAGHLPQPIPGNAVALVNGVPITSSELDSELSNLLISPTAHGALSRHEKDAPRKAALEELIVRELAYQRAKANGLTVGKNEVATTVKKIKRRYHTEKSFQEALKAEEISEREFERRIEKDLLLRKISKLELADKARVSDDDARRHYEANKAKFVLPESLRLFRIVVKLSPGIEAEAKNKSDELYTKLNAGADFAEVAYKFSEDEYRVLSGAYGTIHRGQLPPELEATVFAAKPGETSQPFKTDDGWQIIRVEGKQPERQLRYEEVRERIKTALYQQRERQRRLDFVASLKAEAKIEYLSR